MTLDTATLLKIALALAGVGVLAAYAAHSTLRPRNVLFIWPKNGDHIPVKLKTGKATHTWTDPADKRKVKFNLDTDYARRLKNGALRYFGDPETGALIRWNGHEKKWEYQDPKYLMASFDSGREMKLARSMGDDKKPWFSDYVMPALIIAGIMLAAILYFVYQMWNKSQHGA